VGAIFLALIMIITIRAVYLLLIMPKGRDIEDQIHKEIPRCYRRNGETWQLHELPAQLNKIIRAEIGSAFISLRNRIKWLTQYLLQVLAIAK